MSQVPLYKNFNKTANDHLDKNFPDSIFVETNYTTPQNIVFTSKNVVNSGKSVFNTTLNAKFSLSGVEFKKVELKQNGNFNLETTYSGVGNGLNLNLNYNSKDLYPAFEYRRPNLTAYGETDSSLTATTLNALFAQQSFLVGAQVTYNQKKTNVDYDLALGYENPKYLVGLEALKSLSLFKLGGFYKANNLTTLATRIEGTLEDPARLVTLGVTYKPQSDAIFKAKVDSNLDSALSLQYQLAKGVKFSTGIRAPLRDLSRHVFGLEVNLG